MNVTIQTACQSIQRLSKAIAKNEDSFFNAMIQFDQTNLQPVSALCQRGVTSEYNAVRTFVNARKESYIEPLLKIYNSELNAYISTKSMNHRQRRKFLEDMIYFLNALEIELFDNEDYLLLLAKVYFYRSLLFRPKGRSVPARKIEALKRSEKLLQAYFEKNTDNIEAWQLIGQIMLTLLTFNEPYDEKRFKEAVEKIKNKFNPESDSLTLINDIHVWIKYCERFNKNDTLKELTVDILKHIDFSKEYVLYLLISRIAFQKNKVEDTRYYLEKSLDKAPNAFADPYWDDLVDFIILLEEKKCDIWKTAAIVAHKVCCEKELEIGNVYLRWYWARQSKLYDLAFKAANDPEAKARVSDSLKSRPTLRFKDLREMGTQIDIAHILDQEDEARDNRYLKKKPERYRTYLKKDKFTDYRTLNDQWMVVHFYINELDKCAYALILDCDTGKKTIESFQYNELFRKFLSWQEMEFPEYKVGKIPDLNEYKIEDIPEPLKQIFQQRGQFLYDLCKEMTRSMPFIADFPQHKSILWIPHGFIHRLPLHAAIFEKEGKEIFLFEKHVSRFLPAWHLLGIENRQDGTGKQLLKNYPAKVDLFKKALEKLDKQWDKNFNKRASREHFFESLEKNLQTLILLSHGKGNVNNSFQSHLKLNQDVSILDILKEKNTNIRGCRIFLGACESDMASPIEFMVDEHLSLSTTLLLHGAKEVIAGLYHIFLPTTLDCYLDIIDSNDLAGSLRNWQISSFKDWNSLLSQQKFLHLYLFAPFRVMGVIPTRTEEIS